MVFAGLPLVLVAVLSFTSWNGLGTPAFNGLDNWSRMLSDSSVLDSLRISAILTVLCWAVQTPLALLLGVWAAGRQRNRAALSSIFFLPLLMSTAAIAITWLTLLDPNFGLAAKIGPYIGFPDGNIIGSPRGALGCIVVVVAWQFVPFHTLLYQAAARQIPQSLYDAATVDGAGRVRQFRHITVPQLRNTIITSSILMLVGSLTYFETVLILTAGGPGSATNILPQHMYMSAFRDYQMGYASVIALSLVALGTALSLVIVRFSGFAKMRSTLEGM
ncbi:sugar ABC transporter permease [Actinomadura sp. DC4]|nr:sugar ABC transporter permease [Actinomadura sp. DC4]MDN3355897.1 sugar ABC transporter permease [Actinomadura sp. DC4]